ncbi:STAS domain-containing protein [bacterium]|jgi:anti-sigma B factor antagonist|nr:STAS domain-containing protein [bacterium]MBT3582124.1 STAS domain-containing protein [bacterium]MBT4552857.1 STAS domain-containing protein [bacterium]MBT5988610.1 STAS domain-containing protein [bacterium]MBT7087903.1 STAS domain-containing protein [bacterium]
MEISTKKLNDIDVVHISGRLDAYTSEEAEKTINALLDKGTTKLLVDFAKVDYISSSGLRIMLASLKRLNRIKGSIKLANLKPALKEVFEISGFNQLFNFYENEEDAVKSFGTDSTV